MELKSAIAYARVSTETQADDELPITTMIKICFSPEEKTSKNDILYTNLYTVGIVHQCKCV